MMCSDYPPPESDLTLGEAWHAVSNKMRLLMVLATAAVLAIGGTALLIT
jgi:hypothetical protein